MRAIIFLFIISSINLLGQSQYKKDMDIFNLKDPDLLKLNRENTKENKTFPTPLKINTINEIIWVLDSTYTYLNDVNLSSKLIVTNRNYHGSTTESLLSILKKDGNNDIKWVKKDTNSYTYYNNNLLNEQLQGIWSISTNELTDTFIYYKQNIDNQKEIHIEIEHNNKSVLKYNDNGYLIKEYQIYNYKTGDDYIKARLLQYEYDNSGNRIEKLSQNLQSSTNSFINNSQELFYFDQNNNIKKAIKRKWSSLLKKWVNENKWDYEFDEMNNETKFFRTKWNLDSLKWMNEFRGILEYDENGNRISYFIQRWHNIKQKWGNINKYFYTYNDNFISTGYYSQIWSSSDQKWENFNKYIYKYDNFDNRILFIKQKWGKSENEWLNIFKRKKEYNSKNILQKTTELEWSESENIWVNDNLNLYIFDINENLIQELEKKWDTTLVKWNTDKKIDYFWSQFETTSLEKTNRNDFFIYPNPATDYLVIQSELNLYHNDVFIYSTAGNLVYQTKMNNNNKVNLESISPGIYYLKINTENSKYIEKLIKIK